MTAEDVADAERDDRIRWAAELLERRVVDVELFGQLAQVRFEGPGYDRFASELAGYGLAVSRAWIATGKMNAMCLRWGYPIGPRPARLDQDDVEALADETVVAALRKFRADALRDRGWRPDGGASLKTYFVNGCVFAFLNPYKRWRRQQDAEAEWAEQLVREDDPTEDDFRTHVMADPLARVLEKAEINQLYGKLQNDRERLLLTWDNQGYSAAEIADLLGGDLRPGSVAQALRRLKQRLARDHLQDGSRTGGHDVPPSRDGNGNESGSTNGTKPSGTRAMR